MKATKIAIIIMAMILGTAGKAMAQAGQTPDNPLVLEVGKTYDIDSKTFNFKALYAIFNATEDGVVTMTHHGADQLYLFTDATYTEESANQPQWNGSYSPKAYALSVKAGTTYYLANTFMMNCGKIEVTFGTEVTPIELVKQSPEEGSPLMISSDILTLEFSKNVSYESITLNSGEKNVQLTGYTSGSYLTIEIKEPIMEIYKSGTLKKGDALKIVIEGLCDERDNTNIYGTDGKLTLNYVAPAKPVELVSANNVPGGTPNNMETFSSWFMPEDESGVVTLTFDGELNIEGDNMPKATLKYGELEKENGLYIEQLEVTLVDSKTLAVDFRNKLRRHKDMLTIDETFDIINITISNVHGNDGQFAYSAGNSAIGSYTYTYNFSEVKYMVMSDFTPYTSNSKPASLDGVKSIELWLSEEGSKKMNYSGVWFITTYEGKQDTTLVSKSDINIVADEYDANATILTIPVPQFNADANSNVIVTLANVATPDGIDHSENYTAIYTTSIANGIEEIAGNSEHSSVYSIDGMLIMKNATKADIKTLKKGAYIINKKKVVR